MPCTNSGDRTYVETTTCLSARLLRRDKYPGPNNPKKSTPVFRSDYFRVYVYLRRYPLEIIPVFPSIYIRILFYLH